MYIIIARLFCYLFEHESFQNVLSVTLAFMSFINISMNVLFFKANA